MKLIRVPLTVIAAFAMSFALSCRQDDRKAAQEGTGRPGEVATGPTEGEEEERAGGTTSTMTATGAATDQPDQPKPEERATRDIERSPDPGT